MLKVSKEELDLTTDNPYHVNLAEQAARGRVGSIHTSEVLFLAFPHPLNTKEKVLL